MPTLLEALASYLPARTVRRLASRGAAQEEPEREEVEAAALLADVSGFTALAERLAERGPGGAEALNRALNAYFGPLLDLVGAWGGDVLKFAGDAMLVAWPVEGDAAELATWRAAACALAMQGLPRPEADGAPLALRVGVGAGRFAFATVGGREGRWEMVVTGDPLAQVGRIMGEARPGEVVVTAAAAAQLADRVIVAPVASAGARLVGLREAPALPAPQQGQLLEAFEGALEGHLPAAVLARLRARQADWLAELRPVSVLFVHLPALGAATPLAEVQELVHALQELLARFEGQVNKLSVDEKGVSLLAAFGLPPDAHADDPARAVQAAVAIARALTARGRQPAVGLATGRAFCGEVGNAWRREYTLIGDVVNLAARLMQAAEADGGGVLVDAATAAGASKRWRFEALPPVALKGKAQPTPVHRPTGPEAPAPVGDQAALVGRQVERAAIETALDLLAEGQGTVLALEAEAGLGKSRLVAHLVAEARARGFQVLEGAGDAVERTTAYHAWSAPFLQLLEVPAVPVDLEERRRLVLGGMACLPEGEARAPLLEVLAPLDLPDTPTTAALTGQARAQATRDLLIEFLGLATHEAPTLVVLDDAHWLDSASWTLAAAVARRLPGVLLVLATRPLGEAAPTEWRQLTGGPGARVLQLEALSPAEVEQLVCARLGVRALPSEAAALIRTRAEGHPYFGQELAYALRDAGVLVVEGEVARLAGPLDQLDLPETIQGVITSRVDRLPAPEQLTLKVASVVGRVFPVGTVAAVHPLEADRPAVPTHLRTLEQLDLTPLERGEPDPTYLFKHAITQEVVYNLMLFEQRQGLHRRLAEWLEGSPEADLPALHPVLAHHWRAAGDAERALAHLERAGNQALRVGAYSEASGFFDQAVRWAADAPPAEATRLAPPERHAAWEVGLGEAWFGQGRSTETAPHLERAMALVGRPMPRMVGLALVHEVATQVLHRLGWCRVPRVDRVERVQLALRAMRRLGQITYLRNEVLRTAYVCVATVNLAEGLPAGPELATGYANLSFGLAILPWRRASEAYGRMALAAAEAAGDPEALGWALELLAITRMGWGHWDRFDDLAQRAIPFNDQAGQLRNRDECVGLLAVEALYQGRLRDAMDLYGRHASQAEARGDDHVLCQALQGAGWTWDRMGDEPGAREAHGRALVAAERVGAFEANGIRASLAALAVREGDLATARTLLADCGPALRCTRANFAYNLEAYSSWCEALATLAQAASPGAERRAALCDLAASVARIEQFGRTLPVGRARAGLWRGALLALQGRRAAARSIWRRAIPQAEALGLVLDAAWLRLELARSLRPGRPERQALLDEAGKAFELAGAARHLAWVQEAR